ncbi:NAD(P)-dependent oxidoreductase [Sphingomonas naphthae]|uniref:NAD(P)-dependent oxidoreductase n=1 Tax=Sphingomonas naphthae TaxID=1813468 RepID=A0ABY7TRK5_9SPHN|nr:NAD(P)-dependent oxidoreductase [Sphingomonas naphthae]WCT74469.1 NAD(P)-dependent oxidoreductase [Sphingomonas naphthae]
MNRLGFVGLGDMGAAMAGRLLELHPLRVWDRTKTRSNALAAHGAVTCDTPARLAAACDLVGLCLTSDDAVDAVLFGDDGLLADRSSHGLTIVNLSTGSSEYAREVASRTAGLGVAWVEAPVSGGPEAARDRQLTMFIGDTIDAVSSAEPLLAALSANRTRLGGAGSSQAAKLCNQIIVAASLKAIAKTIAIARAAGVDVACLPAALRGGFADSRPLQLFGPRMAAHRFYPRSGSIALMAKDAAFAAGMAAAIGVEAPMLRETRHSLDRAVAHPEVSPDDDLSALLRLFDRTDRDD